MSSILEALRKLENDSDEQQNGDMEWPQRVDARVTLYGRLKRNSSMRLRWIFGLIAFAAVCSGVVWMIAANHFIRMETSGSESVAAVTVKESVRKPESIQTKELPPVSTPEMVARNTRMNDPVSPADNKSESHSSVSVSGQETVVDDVRPELQNIPPVDVESALAADVFEETSESVLVRPEKLADSGWLTLHAISWSENPDKRIAVINDSVVRVGRRVSGGLVRQIEKDYVVVEKDGEKYLLPF